MSPGPSFTRRQVLGGLGLGGAAGVATWTVSRRGATTTAAPPVPGAEAAPTTSLGPAAADPALAELDALPGVLTPAPVEQRILVVIELNGGNDGLSTVVPANTGRYYDLRPRMSVPADDVLPLDDEIGLHPNLTRLYRRQKAVVEGVGPVDGTLSHFDMQARWETGDPGGHNGLRSGFLARLADALDTGQGTVGLSVSGFTPRFHNATAPTLSIDSLDQLSVLTDDQWIYPSYRRTVSGFTGGPLTAELTASWQRLNEIGKALPDKVTKVDPKAPMVTDGGDLGAGLAAAAQLLAAELGVRVIHARLDGFDTHDGFEWKYPDLMTKLDVAVDGFLVKMHELGLSNRVLVATTSEFGRRVKQNGSGFDHGAGSTMLLFGPVVPGRYGQASSLSDLDPLGNLKTNVPFDVYLGTLAQSWLGVDAASVLPSTPEVLPIIGR